MLNTYSTVALKYYQEYYQRKGNQPKRVRTERKKKQKYIFDTEGIKKNRKEIEESTDC